MNNKERNTSATESEKTNELNKCLSRYGEVSAEGKNHQRRIFLTGEDLPLDNSEKVVGMIRKDVNNMKLNNVMLADKKSYNFQYQADRKDKNGEKIPYLDIELVNRV